MSLSFDFKASHSRIMSNNIRINKVNCFGDKTTK